MTCCGGAAAESSLAQRQCSPAQPGAAPFCRLHDATWDSWAGGCPCRLKSTAVACAYGACILHSFVSASVNMRVDCRQRWIGPAAHRCATAWRRRSGGPVSQHPVRDRKLFATFTCIFENAALHERFHQRNTRALLLDGCLRIVLQLPDNLKPSGKRWRQRVKGAANTGLGGCPCGCWGSRCWCLFGCDM